MKILTRDNIKKTVGFIAGASVGAVAKGMVRNNYVPENKLQAAELFVACVAIGGMAAAKTREYTDEKVDSTLDKIIEKHQELTNPPTQTQE